MMMLMKMLMTMMMMMMMIVPIFHVGTIVVFIMILLTVDGGWTSWTTWSGCDVTCGTGHVTRGRNCSNPVPKYGGSDCSGTHNETKSCTLNPCPGKVMMSYILNKHIIVRIRIAIDVTDTYCLL
ncbi:hypothetical protein DPMN_152708 [Dreissena polymorpha]|uniref:Uncharacterized protein n=1 Tax=Dreissena polymorpha TaxID=45954 RepID=A0A9D4FHY2_DREPO|nr:hypothetical protein DPMN_152708 [Dreissena polymorpha]